MSPIVWNLRPSAGSFSLSLPIMSAISLMAQVISSLVARTGLMENPASWAKSASGSSQNSRNCYTKLSTYCMNMEMYISDGFDRRTDSMSSNTLFTGA